MTKEELLSGKKLEELIIDELADMFNEEFNPEIMKIERMSE